MFRTAIVPVFWCISASVFVLGTSVGLILVGLDHGWGTAWRYAPSAVGVSAVLAVLWAVLWALILHFCFPTRVSSEGVWGYSFWGVRRFIAWEHISMARPFRILNLRWVRLYSSSDTKVTYVALFPSDSASFRAEIHRLAPPQCPILKY